MIEREVTFFSDQEKVFGTLSTPSEPVSDSGFPVVILAHGFGSFRDELTGFVEIARRLSDEGIASLRFDFRGCGESGRRGRVHPFPDWIEDMEAAIDFINSIAELNSARIGILGMSVGGGVVCWVGAVDPRIRCIVALASVADGEWWLEHLWTSSRGEKEWSDFKVRIYHDAQISAVEGLSSKVEVSEMLAYGAEDKRLNEEMFDTYPQFVRKMHLSSAMSLIRFKPLSFIHQIDQTPILFIHSEDDSSVPIAHSEMLFKNVKGVKKFQKIKGSPHCFWVGNKSEEVQQMSVAWIVKYL